MSSLAAVSALAGRNDDLQAPIVTGDLQPGARAVLSDPSGRPLLLEGHYGGGLISALTFDPAAAPVAGSQLAVPAWIEALGRTLDHSPGAMPTTRTLPGVDATVAQALPTLRGAALPSPWLVGPLLLLYLLLVAPVNYLFLRRRMGRPDLFWLTAPALAAVFTGAFYWVGTDIQTRQTPHQLWDSEHRQAQRPEPAHRNGNPARKHGCAGTSEAEEARADRSEKRSRQDQ